MMKISKIKIVLFDFDNTLCIHTFHGKRDEHEDGVKIISGDLSVWETCEINEQLKRFMHICEKENIRMGLISTTVSYRHMEMKQKFVKERYGVELENFCVSSQDGKLDMLNTIADAFHYKKSEIAIVDDYWYQLERAADGGFQAYFPIQILNYMNQ